MGRQLKIDSLVEDIYALLEGKRIFDPVVLEKFGPEIGEVFTSKLQARGEERVPTLRMSNIGRPLRQLWYELNGYKSEEISGKTYLKFIYGDIIETLVLVLAEAAGHTVERFQEEVEVDGIKGHIDAVIDGVLIDVKSASPYSYNKFATGELFNQDPFGYVGQISGYAHALGLPAAFLAVNKVLGDVCILEVPQQKIDGYDVRNRIQTVREAVLERTPPERCYDDELDGKSGNRKLGISCSYCGFKDECWKESNNGEGLKVYAYSTGPRYLTEVKREPKVFSINKESNE